MEFHDEFVLDIPIRSAWRFMSNPSSFASCIPGYVDGTMKIVDDTHFQLTVKQTIARIPAKYEMKVEVVEMAEPNRLVARIRGRDSLLGSNVDATSALNLSSSGDDATTVSYRMDMKVTGKVATFGYPVIVAKGKTFSREFVETLIREIMAINPEATEEAEPAESQLAATGQSDADAPQ